MLSRRCVVPRWRLAVMLGLMALGNLMLLPAIADAADKRVRIKTESKKRVVRGPVQVIATAKGKPRKVTFWVGNKRHQVDYSGPHQLGGPSGSLDPATLKMGRHRVIVRAYYGRGVKNRSVASTAIVIRKSKTAGRRVTTRLPGIAVASASAVRPLPVWDGSADLGFGSWAEVQRIGGGSVAEIVDSPVLAGHKAFRFVIDGGERAELLAYQPQNRFGEGAEWWFGDVLFVPSQPNKSVGWEDSSHHTLMQWKNDGTGSPPFELDRRQNGLLLKINTAGEEVLLVPEAQLYDRPIAIEVRAKFSSSAAVGELEVWVNGQLKVPTVKAATLFAGRYSYFKQGQYGVGRGNVVYWQGAKRGTTRPSVQR